MALKQLNSWKHFGGYVKKFVHPSTSTKTDMKFSLFLPPQFLQGRPVPVLYWLSGLTCTEDNFIQKAGACQFAAHHGLALVAPDTSPRGVKIEGDSDHWDFGVGAGFYLNATQPKWKANYRMYDYVTKELPAVLLKEEVMGKNFNGKQGVSGHSMGGHGALICYLKNPGMYQSVSAFAPICNPSDAPWGQKAFTNYLGENKDHWKEWDATHLIQQYKGQKNLILIDQGFDDEWLRSQLKPEALVAASAKANHPVTLNQRVGYDHSYWMISTFMEQHIRHHARALIS